MADSLIESLFGSADAVQLSWSDQRSLERAAAGAMASAVELRQLRSAVKDVELAQARVGTWIASAVWGLERELGLRLDQQTTVLLAQRELLASIDAALRTPAKTRAAERIADTGELLRRGRYERALAIAREATDDDPNNPAGFRAAGWALCGLRRLDEARAAFAECAAAADGNERSEALRQAARLAFLVESPAAALATLAAVDDMADESETRAMEYDRALYLAEQGETDAAGTVLRRVCEADSRYALQALNDQVLGRHPALVADLTAYVQRLIASMFGAVQETERDLEAVDRALEELTAELEDPAAVLRGVREQLASDVAELRARRAELAAGPAASASRDGEPLPIDEVHKRERSARRLARAAQDLVAARPQRQSAAADAAEAERAARERTQERVRLFEDAIARTVAEAGRKCQVTRSALDFRATVRTAGLLRSSAWEVSVDESLRVWVIPQRG